MKELDSDKKIILYGAGVQNLQLVYSSAVSVGLQIERIVDKDAAKQGTFCYGTEIVSPEWLLEYDKKSDANYYVIITVHTPKVAKEIKKWFAVLKNATVYFYDEFLKIVSKIKKKKIFSFQIHLVDHCDLKCACCNHFSPLVTENFYLTKEIFERDVRRMSELTAGDVAEIHLLGGEPLLHPHICEFPPIIRDYFPKTNIDFTTNGLKLLTMPKTFFNVCREYQISIWITRYPVSFDYSAVAERLKNENLNFKFTNSGNSVEIPKEMVKVPLVLKGNQDAELTFEHCNICTSYPVRDGKIYVCPPSAYVDFFNSYFGESLPGPEVNGVDLFSVNDLPELLEKLSQPAALCAYCDTLSPECVHPWGVSKRDILEWTI